MLIFIAECLPFPAIAAFLAGRTKRGMAKCLPAAVLLLLLLLYIFGLFGALEAGVYFIYALGAAAAVFAVRDGIAKKDAGSFLGLAGVAFFSATVFFCCRGRVMLAWDEFSHWGTAVKNMYILNALPCVEGSTAIYKSYPPVIGLLQYYCMHPFPAFREDVLFMAKDLFSFALLVPFFSGMGKKDIGRILLTAFLALTLPLIEYYYFYRSVHVDGIMGLAVFYMLCCAWHAMEEGKLFDWLCCGLGAFALCGIKSSGIGLSVLTLLAVYAAILFAGKAARSTHSTECRAARYAFLLPVAFVLFLEISWKIKQNACGATDYWNMSSALGLSALKEFIRSPKPYQKETLEKFFAALFALREDTYAVKLSPLTWLMLPLFPAIAAWFAEGEEKRKKRIAAITGTLCAAYLAWLFVLLLSYLFVFADFEALNLDGFERYSSTFQLGMEAFLLFVFAETVGKREKGAAAFLLIACLLAANLFNGSDLMKATVVAPAYNAYSCRQREAYAKVPNFNGLDPETDRLLFIGQQSEATGMDFYSLRYELTPLYIGMIGSWSIGEPYDGDDDWTVNYTAEEWRTLVFDSDYTYLYVYRADDRFVSDYGSCFEDPTAIEDDALFRIDRTSGKALFVRAEN